MIALRFPLLHVTCALVSFLIVANRALAQGHTEAGHSTGKYVGAEVCQGCHEDQYKTFAQSAHAQTLKREKPAEQGCEACHGPGAAHVEAGDPDKIRRFGGATPDTIQSVCATCHKTQLRESHTRARLACLTCHSAHHYQQQKAMLVADESRLCRKCHQESIPGPFHL